MTQTAEQLTDQPGLLTQQNEQSKQNAARKQQFEDAFGFSPDDPFSLECVTSSKGFRPQKVIIYGVPGVGKSTFAATWPSPIFLRTEDGAGALDVPTFPKIARQTAEIAQAVKALRKPGHKYKTLVIDSLDWMEPIVWNTVCKEGGKANIEDFGYGKGYVKVDDKWRQLFSMLDQLREERNMHIVCIAHADAKPFDPPDSDSYMRYSIKLHKRGTGLWTEWAEMLLFCNYQATILEQEGGGKAKARGSGDRIIYTQERPAYQAKSRWPLPDSIFIGNDPKWSAFHTALSECSEGAYSNGTV